MKFCTDHWTKLKAEIERRGLSSLIATSGEQAAAQAHQELKDGASKATFDPLMGAHNAIVVRAMDRAGLELLMDNADGSEK